MTYRLYSLAPGSYDLALDGVIVGSVVREVRGGDGDHIWHAELLNDPPPEKRPPPFSKVDHTFGSLQAVVAWLGEAEIDTNTRAAYPWIPCILVKWPISCMHARHENYRMLHFSLDY